ncbi:MAG TPA: hypothetical protein VMM81_02715 [Acidimicrobiia bacterium]|nr:hypothetical protein [Acidimicrobiia bacterium]
MRRRQPHVIALVVMSLALVACGGARGSDTPGRTGDQTGTTAVGGSDTTVPPGAPPSGDGGTATVNGTTYTFDMVLKCEYVEDLAFDLEMQALGSSPDGRVQLDLVVYTFAGGDTHDVSWFGPEGIFSGGAMMMTGSSWTDIQSGAPADGPIISTDGGVATGTVVMSDIEGSDTTLEVAFAVPIPTEDFACR